MNSSIGGKIKSATKWSAITEALAKLVAPIVNMVLARLLTPEAFGIVTTLTMVISFAELFTNAGFQKYIIQHDFKDDTDRDESTNVAFWSNLAMSVVLWAIIAIFANPLASLVGNPGLGYVLTIACASIPLQAFSSIQFALYKRDFDFKTLFKVRIVGSLIPVFVTIPLAIWLKSYWALVIGTIAVNAVNALLLSVFSQWKPRLFYSFGKLKEMLSFASWAIFEDISIWLTSYIDVFIVGTALSSHYLGLYKTTSALIGQVIGIVTAITTPVLFSALSRLQDDNDAFQELFFKFQKIVGILIIPLGTGIYCFRDLVTEIAFGEQWMEASGFVGLWALTSAISVILSHYASEVYRAKGKPKLSVLVQWLHIIVLWPAILISTRYGFEALYITRSLIRFELIAVNLVVLYVAIGISPLKMMTNVFPAALAALGLFLTHYFLPDCKELLIQLTYILICSVVYFGIILAFKEERQIIFNLKSILKK